MRRSKEQGMLCRIRLIEPFPATINDRACVSKIRNAAGSLGLKVKTPGEPFRWSEDFGYYLQETKGAFFGIGTGETRSGLHTAEYEFNDEIMETAIKIYRELINEGGAKGGENEGSGSRRGRYPSFAGSVYHRV